MTKVDLRIKIMKVLNYDFYDKNNWTEHDKEYYEKLLKMKKLELECEYIGVYLNRYDRYPKLK